MAKKLLQQNEIKDFVRIVLFATQGLTWRPDIVAKKEQKRLFLEQTNTVLFVPLQPRLLRLQKYEALCFQSCICL